MSTYKLCTLYLKIDCQRMFRRNVCNFVQARRLFNSINNSQSVVELPIGNQRIFHDKKKLIKVAIIGMPNAGKSTLINNLMDRTVCPTSKKVHTTRSQTNAIKNVDSTQIIFLDTPGVVSNSEQKRYKLEKSFVNDCTKSLNEADVIGVIHDVSNVWTRDRLDIKLIKLLERYNMKASFLVLNKIDTLKSKRKLLDLTRSLTQNSLNSFPFGNIKKHDDKSKGWTKFNEIFMISAVNGDGVDDIQDYLIRQSYPANWLFEEHQWTQQMPEDIVLNIVKATLLDFLPQEIPYRLKTELEYFEVNDKGILNTVALIYCPNERIRSLVVGVGDGKLRQITEKTQQDLLNAFKHPVRIRLVVKVRARDDNN